MLAVAPPSSTEHNDVRSLTPSGNKSNVPISHNFVMWVTFWDASSAYYQKTSPGRGKNV